MPEGNRVCAFLHLLSLIRTIFLSFRDYLCQESVDKKKTEFSFEGWEAECTKVGRHFIAFFTLSISILLFNLRILKNISEKLLGNTEATEWE